MRIDIVPSVPLNVDVRDGQIIDIGPYRHRVDWNEHGPSTITYCNGCGSGIILEIMIEVHGQMRVVDICGDCDCFQGFAEAS